MVGENPEAQDEQAEEEEEENEEEDEAGGEDAADANNGAQGNGRWPVLPLPSGPRVHSQLALGRRTGVLKLNGSEVLFLTCF